MRIFTTILLSIVKLLSVAGTGDTTWVNTNESHLDWYGRKDQTVTFPDNSTSYQRIMMYATIGCPTGGCSGWDYTNKIEIRHNTGEIDSNEVFINSFQVDGNNVDTAYYSFDTTYTYFYNAGVTDSTANTPLQIIDFETSQNGSFPADTSYYWASNYWNYIFDGTGTIIDSVLVPNDSMSVAAELSYYNLYDIIENYELARVITPYGSYYADDWEHTWLFDVSDFEPILHGTTTLSSFYGGWQDGFTMEIDFAFVEGTPSREVLSIDNIYSSGMGGYKYGEIGNPDVIEESLVPVSADYGANTSAGKLRVTHSGHSFGGNENCAEFCQKNYYIKLGSFTQFTQLVWRDDCGMNPLYHQSGTWIYDRANWCPGEVCITREHDVTPFVTPGTTIDIDMDMDTYSYSGNPGGGSDPSYIIETQLVQYGPKNFVHDASVERIVAPNVDNYFNRYNPICGKPIIRIKNGGAETLTSATITYGAKDAQKLTYEWTGSLDFLEETEVELPVDPWTNWAEGDASGIFEATISNPNGAADENTSNDQQTSTFEQPPVWSSSFYIWFVTNGAASESSYYIQDEQGNKIHEFINLDDNTTYKDTIDLAPGCYQFKVEDTDCDGISFFNNNDGNGLCRIMEVDGGFTIIETFERDFGCEISQWFTVGYTTGEKQIENIELDLELFPNPTAGVVNIGATIPNLQDIEINVYSALGALVYTEKRNATSKFTSELDLSDQSKGVYFVSLKTANQIITRKVALTK
jgi:hypothetical protein